MTTTFWKDGEEARRLTLMRPCACGCDERDGAKGVGYLTASSDDGNGFSIWIQSEAAFKMIENAITQGE